MTSATLRNAAPASAAELAEVVRGAAESGTSMRVRGRGSWLDAGRPVRADASLSTAGLSGVTDYTPGDLTLTARAGTTLAEIARVTRAERQWLTLDPAGGDESTIGAVIATASAGTLAGAFGTPRDQALGLEVVTGAGAVIRTGGRVVKNVAGYDLTRLFTGSWGTLGVITEVSIRLRSLPEVDMSVALDVDDEPAGLDALLARIRAAAIAPAALELVNGALARRLAVGSGATLLVRLTGNAEAVRAQQAVLGALGPARACSTTAWDTLRACEPGGAATLRLSRAPSRIGELWRVARCAGGETLVHASLVRGVVRCIVPSADAAAVGALVAAAHPTRTTVIGERLPAPVWSDVPSRVADALSMGVKQAYDPAGILNPGLLGGDA
ncbi:MAG: FAD-binding protein [Gemmatimonadaceae bacterium]